MAKYTDIGFSPAHADLESTLVRVVSEIVSAAKRINRVQTEATLQNNFFEILF